jgi:hypothetical protein
MDTDHTNEQGDIQFCQKYDVLHQISHNARKQKEEEPAFRYNKGLSGDSFESSIFFLQLLLAVALDRKPD